MNMATGESIAHLNTLLTRGVAVRRREGDVTYYERA